jgi:REP element-mobilizing transposase RayT
MENLDYGFYYHIYNRGNNREKLFYEPWNYAHFMDLYVKYIHPIADTYAYCLMGNHFHFLIRVKDKEEIELINSKNRPIWKYFADYFNAYAKIINLKYDRTGSLFQERFRRKKVYSEEYLCQLIHYIHLNPVKHGISNSYDNYPYSSYQAIISGKSTRLEKEKVIKIFDDLENFIYFHKKETDTQMINEFIEDD